MYPIMGSLGIKQQLSKCLCNAGHRVSTQWLDMMTVFVLTFLHEEEVYCPLDCPGGLLFGCGSAWESISRVPLSYGLDIIRA